MTVTVCAQVLELPAASTAVQVTVVLPIGKLLGALLLTVTELQLSETLGVPRVTPVATHWPTFALTVTVPGQVMLGAAVSRTMNDAVQVLELPALSVAVMVTVLVPRPTSVPMVGLCASVTPLQSEAVTALVKFGTLAWQLPLAEAEILVAHVAMFGTVVSRTMNDAVQVFVLPLASATLIVTVLVPTPASVPMVGDCAMVMALHVSDATTALVKLGVAAWQLPLAEAVILVAQVAMFGMVESVVETTRFVEALQPVMPSVIVELRLKLPLPVALTVTVELVVALVMVPLPEIDQR